MDVRRFARRQFASPLPETMALDFIGRGDTLDPRITFSRTSNATQFDSAGNLVYAPHNLLTFSESFDASAWSKNAITVTSNAIAASNGTTTADVLIADATTAEHFSDQAFTALAGNTYTVSAYFKSNGLTDVGLRFTVGGVWAGGASPQVRFNLANGTITTPIGGSPSASSIEDLGNGWFRCSMSAICVAAGTPSVRVQLMSGTNNTFAGNGVNGIATWGAQLNVDALQPYYPTTVKNLLGYTQEFDNAAWTKTNSTITANSTAAPDGSTTADKLVENTATSEHYFENATGITGVLNTTFVASFYLKASERTRARIVLVFGGANGVIADANLTAGTIAAASSFGTATAGVSSITSVGSGWYRISVSGSSSASASMTARIELLNASGNRTYTGDGTSGIFIWGAQLSDSASLDPYVYNPSAAFTSTAYYGPRFDYDPVTLAARGLLIEEQRTNSTRNNTMVGAVAGTPGTLPTNWAEVGGGIGTLTRQIVGTGTENGITYVDLKLSGTTSTVSVGYAFEAIGGIAASNAQTWTNSFWCKVVAGSTSNITSANSLIEERTGAGAFLANTVSAISPTSTLTRFSQTFTLNAGATVGQVRGGFILLFSSGVAIDITIRIGLPQLELGAFATSVIPTTTAAATRATDFASMLGANFTNWYSQPEGTMFVEGSVAFPVSGTNQFMMRASDNTYNSSNALLVSDGGVLRIATAAGGVFDGLAGTVNALANITFKTAGAYRTNDLAISSNGGTAATDPTATIPLNMTRMDLGGDHAGFNRIRAGYIRRISYYPRRLPDAELQKITV